VLCADSHKATLKGHPTVERVKQAYARADGEPPRPDHRDGQQKWQRAAVRTRDLSGEHTCCEKIGVASSPVSQSTSSEAVSGHSTAHS